MIITKWYSLLSGHELDAPSLSGPDRIAMILSCPDRIAGIPILSGPDSGDSYPVRIDSRDSQFLLSCPDKIAIPFGQDISCPDKICLVWTG